MKILVISTTRADFGILENLIKKLRKDKFFNLRFLVTGSHFNRDQGLSLKEILKSKILIHKRLRVKLNSKSLQSIFKFNSNLTYKFFKYLKNSKPDIVVVFGDRFEMFLLTFCSYLMRIPIAHLHGGEISEGSIDDSLRHAITKLSNFHFVSNKTHQKRVIQLGEQPKYVKNVGSLIEEKILNLKIINKKKLEKLHKINFANVNFIITYHPDTIKSGNTEKNFQEILKSIEKFDNINFFFTAPGSDYESEIIKKRIIEFKKGKKNIFYVKNFGSQSYLSMLHHVNGLIGNSSSGILEMPIIKGYTINIGNRQKGRGNSSFIYNVPAKQKEISKLIIKISKAKILTKALSKKKILTIKKIISNLKKIRLEKITYKKFFDI